MIELIDDIKKHLGLYKNPRYLCFQFENSFRTIAPRHDGYRPADGQRQPIALSVRLQSPKRNVPVQSGPDRRLVDNANARRHRATNKGIYVHGCRDETPLSRHLTTKPNNDVNAHTHTHTARWCTCTCPK